MIIPDALITTPPLWWSGSRVPYLAYGPFVVVRGKNKIYGMFLDDDSKGVWEIFDGNRYRFVQYDKAEAVGDEIHFEGTQGKGIIRGLNLSDAGDLGLDPSRAGLTKEDVITKALLAFQPLPL